MERFARSPFSSMREKVARRKRENTRGRALKNAMLARGAPFVLRIACSMLLDSREDAKVKGTRKVGGEGKRKKEGISEPGTGYVKNG